MQDSPEKWRSSREPVRASARRSPSNWASPGPNSRLQRTSTPRPRIHRGKPEGTRRDGQGGSPNVAGTRSFRRHADDVQQHFGKVNQVYNNAGIAFTGDVEISQFKDIER